MKPAWDELGTFYQGSANVVIGDVDCTADDAKKICEDEGIKGFPTIMYYTESNGKDGEKYEGGRDLKALKKFVKKTLKGTQRVCEVATKSNCIPEEIAIVEK